MFSTTIQQEIEVKKSTKVALQLLATIAVGACSDSNNQTADAQRECVDNRTTQVVSRDWCTPGHPSYLPIYAWYYGGAMYRSGTSSYIRGGTFTAPSRSSRSFSRQSPTVSRGVIGGGATGKAAG